MENANINKAHHFYRIAEVETDKNRYAKAIEAHSKAIEYLELACGDTTNHHALESLNLQKDWHARQVRILEKKKRLQEQNEQMKKLAALTVNANPSSDDDEDGDENKNPIQVAIVQTMKETDNLLKILISKSSGGNNSDCESLKSFSTTDTDEKLVSFDGMDNSNSNGLAGLKQRKDETVIIEELRCLNGQLQSLVEQLVMQLNKSTKQIDSLKRQVSQLEYEKMKAGRQSSNTNNLKVTTDSSGATSPYVFTPSSELSPDVHDSHVLPNLAPIDNSNSCITILTNH